MRTIWNSARPYKYYARPAWHWTKSCTYYVRPWIKHARPYQPNKLIQTEPTLAHTRAPYTLTAEAKLIKITIIPYTQRLTGIQQISGTDFFYSRPTCWHPTLWCQWYAKKTKCPFSPYFLNDFISRADLDVLYQLLSHQHTNNFLFHFLLSKCTHDTIKVSIFRPKTSQGTKPST